MADGDQRHSKWKKIKMVFSFLRKPAIAHVNTVGTDMALEKALSNLRKADTHYQEATSIIEEFIKDYKKTQRAGGIYEQ